MEDNRRGLLTKIAAVTGIICLTLVVAFFTADSFDPALGQKLLGGLIGVVFGSGTTTVIVVRHGNGGGR